jgi:hypothetical protein
MPMNSNVAQVMQPVRAAARTLVFFLKVLPMLPSRPIDWVTKPPVIERLRVPTGVGEVDADLYLPGTAGPHPGILVSLGVVPFGVDHPQVPRLGEALARSGFAALIYWSPAMRDLRLDPEDVPLIAAAYERLLVHPAVDPERSGLLGTCVGGGFALLAAAHPSIRDRVSFVAAFAPYSSMWTLARDIASSSRLVGELREPWPVDQLTRRVFVHSMTGLLEPDQAERLGSLDLSTTAAADLDQSSLSADAAAVYSLLVPLDADTAEDLLRQLPARLREQLDALSPLDVLSGLRAPLIVFGHDRDDLVVPVGESRCLRAALAGRAGVRYTEFGMFEHADPTKRKLPPRRLLRELAKFYRYVYPIFRHSLHG